MANKKAKWSLNTSGKFYVDDQCIACDACVLEAPRFFKMNDTDGHAFVVAQPKTPKELEECQSALDGCPVDAIGLDGEE